MKMRHHLRLPLRCPVMFSTDAIIGEGRVLDLGVPGCAVQSEVVPLPGEYVRLHILTPNVDGAFAVQVAKVRWVQPHQFGVEFLRFDDGQQVTVRRLFEALEN